jgi:hypothetical protein
MFCAFVVYVFLNFMFAYTDLNSGWRGYKNVETQAEAVNGLALFDDEFKAFLRRKLVEESAKQPVREPDIWMVLHRTMESVMSLKSILFMLLLLLLVLGVDYYAERLSRMFRKHVIK